MTSYYSLICCSQDFMVVTHSVVPCGHMFCGECLSTWLQRNPSCPKCRSTATAPPVRTIAVDNVIETVLEKSMSVEELQIRQKRKQHWQTHGTAITARMKGMFQQEAPAGNCPARARWYQQAWHAQQALGAMPNMQAAAAMRAMHGKSHVC